MTKRERFPEANLQSAIEAVIATNALITDEQYQKLARAIGKSVVMTYRVEIRYSDEEVEPSSDDTVGDEFILEDFNFFEDSSGRKFLAFLKSPRNTFFPLFNAENAFGDTTSVTISRVIQKENGGEIWVFKNLGSRLYIDKLGSEGIVDGIKNTLTSFIGSII